MYKRTATLITVVIVLSVLSVLLGACTTTTPVAPTAAPTTGQVQATTAPVATAAPGVTKIRWYVGLGSGGNPEEIKKEKAFVAKFNSENPQYQLVLDIVQNQVAYDVLKTQIASGNAPDIVGPVGIRGFYSFEGAWLDVAPYAAKYKYDYSDYDPSLLKFLTLGNMGQVGLPFAIYPSALWYNKDLFDEAGLPYPPHKVGEKYQGKDWTFDTMRELAMQMTQDATGKTPNDPGFDPDKIQQFGYDAQYTDLRGEWTFFGAGSFVGADGVTAVLPDVWKTAARWYYDGMWKDHFIPTLNYVQSDLLAQGNTFGSGHVAMTPIHTWYMCCYQKVNWDVAAVPSYNGNTTAKMHADTFGILKTAKNPDASYQVLALLMSKYAADLVDCYGAFPAKISLQAPRLKDLEAQHPGVDFQVFIDDVKYADNPNHESGMPNFQKASDRYTTFYQLYKTKSDLDLDVELGKLVKDLQGVFDQMKPVG
jgi:multiple sugar transport system substrate-binding protein